LDELEILLGKVFARCDNTLLTETCTAGWLEQGDEQRSNRQHQYAAPSPQQTGWLHTGIQTLERKRESGVGACTTLSRTVSGHLAQTNSCMLHAHHTCYTCGHIHTPVSVFFCSKYESGPSERSINMETLIRERGSIHSSNVIANDLLG
jgi:hypothetical protein